MTLFLIGGTGFIGRHVTRRLTMAGRTVTVFHRDEPDALRAALYAAAPNVVVDVIPYTEAQAAAGTDVTLRTVPDEQVEGQPSFDWAYSMATDTRRIRTELGFAEPVTHAEALRRTIAWEEGGNDA